jgi:lipoyl synthase
VAVPLVQLTRLAPVAPEGPSPETPAPLPARKPSWLKVKAPGGPNYTHIKSMMRELGLHTVCEEARCPNIGECWEHKAATFMILGDVCTRNCTYCAVSHGTPKAFDPLEPVRLADAVEQMGLEHVVITSVNRDDLPNGGAEGFAGCISEIRRRLPDTTVEVLIPDFKGSERALRIVMDARPDILNHNLETVRRLQKPVRKRARWDRTLGVLERAKAYAAEISESSGEPYAVHTKSSLMVGLGETRDELTEAFVALRAVDTDILTIGQYLRPSLKHLPVERYYHPDEFAEMKSAALGLGFKHVESGPLVRSSYHARDQVPGAELKALRRRQATIDGQGRVVPLAG